MNILEFLKVRIGISTDEAMRIETELCNKGISTLIDFKERASLFMLSTLGVDSILGSRIIVDLLDDRGEEEEDRVLSVTVPKKIKNLGS